LLDQLLVTECEADLRAGCAERLCTSERDVLLAVAYENTYGPEVESTIECPACEAPFDMNFDVTELVRKVRGASEGADLSHEASIFRLDDECHFRLPTGSDELALAGMSAGEVADQLLSRCIVKGDPQTHGTAIQQAMERLAPVLDVDLGAKCPECGHEHAVRFSLQTYFLSALLQEQPRLTREIHCLARAYGWGLNDVLSLPRKQRRQFVELVDAEGGAAA
jgi:uncharacterized protein (UPF0212 family)